MQLRKSLADNNNIFGSDQCGRSRDAADAYAKTVEELEKSIKGLQGVEVVTGSYISKSFWRSKQKDQWGDLLTAYLELIKKNGEFNRELAETILKNQTLREEGEQALQEAVDNASLVEDAFTVMKDNLTSIFGDFGNVIMTPLQKQLGVVKKISLICLISRLNAGESS